jgi:hypothetical protein
MMGRRCSNASAAGLASEAECNGRGRAGVAGGREGEAMTTRRKRILLAAGLVAAMTVIGIVVVEMTFQDEQAPAEFQRIQRGMTQDEVVAIMGRQHDNGGVTRDNLDRPAEYQLWKTSNVYVVIDGDGMVCEKGLYPSDSLFVRFRRWLGL